MSHTLVTHALWCVWYHSRAGVTKDSSFIFSLSLSFSVFPAKLSGKSRREKREKSAAGSDASHVASGIELNPADVFAMCADCKECAVGVPGGDPHTNPPPTPKPTTAPRPLLLFSMRICTPYLYQPSFTQSLFIPLSLLQALSMHIHKRVTLMAYSGRFNTRLNLNLPNPHHNFLQFISNSSFGKFFFIS